MNSKKIRKIFDVYNRISSAILITFGVILMTVWIVSFSTQWILGFLLLFVISAVGLCSMLYFPSMLVEKIYKTNFEYGAKGFYKIGDFYYSKDWDISCHKTTSDVIRLNESIEVTHTYYLEGVKISQKQYLELAKVSDMLEKPLLKLTEKEFLALTEKQMVMNFRLEM